MTRIGGKELSAQRPKDPTRGRLPERVTEPVSTAPSGESSIDRLRKGARRPWLHPLREFIIVMSLYLLYRAGRLATGGREDEALSNGERVHRVERWLHLPSEAHLQDLAHTLPNLLQMANVYYVSVHFPVAIAFLLWGYLRHSRSEYVWARNLLATQTLFALVVQLLFPLAPPRMSPGWGFEDTMNTIGPSAYGGVGANLANQYAAMPSLHIGWALTIALVVHRTGPVAMRLLTKAHAVSTIVVVVITANHWWLDGIVASGLLVLASRVLPTPRGSALHRTTLIQDKSPKPAATFTEATTASATLAGTGSDGITN